MGARVQIFNRFINGISVALVTLVLVDWLSIQMGTAMKGGFAFGSVGTLGFYISIERFGVTCFEWDKYVTE